MKKMITILCLVLMSSTVFARSVKSSCKEIKTEISDSGSKHIITRTYSKAYCSMEDLEKLLQYEAVATPDSSLNLALPVNLSVKFSADEAKITTTFDDSEAQW